MKRIILTIFALILFVSLTACGAGSGKNTGNETDAVERNESTEAVGGELSEDVEANEDAFLAADKLDWPKELVHEDMPQYTGGKLDGWNYWSSDDENDIVILISETSQKDLEEYTGKLISAGFEEVNGDIYRKGLYEVEFELRGEDSLQISSYKAETVEWPEDLDWVPAIKKGNLTCVIEPSDDMPNYVQLYYINLTQADVEEWEKELGGKGFAVEDGSIRYNKQVELRDVRYKSLYILLQENGTNEWMIDFCFNLDE